jgi:Ca-activated chloride channel homolog
VTRRWRAIWTGALALLVTIGGWVAFQHWLARVGAARFHTVRGGVEYALLEPRMLGIVLVAPLVVWVLGRSLADLPWQQRVLSCVFRVLFLGLLAFGLARPSRTDRTEDICAVVLVDVSDSVSNQALSDARRRVAELARAERPRDLLKLVTFAARPRFVAEIDRQARGLPPEQKLRHAAEPDHPTPGAGSDLDAALELSYGLFPSGCLRRAIVLSDGVETAGDVVAEAARARGVGIRVYTSAYRRPPPGEVAVSELSAPGKVNIGEPFALVASVFSSQRTSARARLLQGETVNALDGVRTLELHPGDNEVRFKSIVRVGGEVTYHLGLDRIGADTFAANNRYSVTLEVPGRPSVLYVEGRPEHAHYLSGALSAQQFDVDVRSAAAMPTSIQELERYDFVILSDAPKEQVSVASQELLGTYVRDLGGGFLFAGGEAGYGLGGWAHSAVERLLPVRMDAERRRDTPGVAMVLVIDRSGSMTGLPLEMSKSACSATVSTLDGNDLIEIIAFDSSPKRYVRFQPARYRTQIQNEIMRIQPGGGTEIFSALDMAYQDISAVEARKKHVILLTDGQSPREGLRDLVQAMIADGVTVTTVGLGDAADGELLRMIADTGGGRYHEVLDASNLPKVFTRETELISRQAAVDNWFPVEQTAPADFLKGVALGSAPMLHGYVSTQMKPAPAQMVLSSDTGEPILARWHVGLGWALAWTSDVKNHWAVDWLRWPGYTRFWGQLVREHMRQKRRRELDMQAEVVGDEVRASVDAFTVDERFDNRLESTLTVKGPEPGGARRQVPMRQIAPGRYEARTHLGDYGSFLLKAEHVRRDADGTPHPAGVSYGHVSYPYPREYASFEPNVERLREAARAGGGLFEPGAAALFAPGSESIRYHRLLWDRFVAAAVGVFLLDLLVRRVRLFDRGFAVKKRRG